MAAELAWRLGFGWHDSPRQASSARGRRALVIALVLALHAALLSLLLVSSRIPGARLAGERAPSMVWLHFPDERRSRLGPFPEAPALRRIAPVRPHEHDAAPLAFPGFAAPAQVETVPRVDWWSEARRVVHDIAAAQATGAAAGSARESQASSGSAGGIWSEPPAHHAGEQYRTETGERIYWVSDRCYLVSEPPASAVADFLTVPRAPRTVCPGSSDTARGDLFKSLPAYGRFHPQ